MRLATAVWGLACLVLTAGPPNAAAADLRTRNFIVNAPTEDLARAVGEAAERYRRDLAIYWTGTELPPWPNPCPIRVVAGSHLAAQGVTTYNRSPVRDFQMEVVGSPQRILDSVLPHEVTHTVLATYFGRPLPRWADEGICTTVEHPSERQKHEVKLREFLRSRRGIAMNKLFLMTEYPSDVLPMYAQGYSVCQFLIAQQGPRKLIEFLGDYMANPSWTLHVRNHYGYESLAELQEAWLAWVADGSGPIEAYVKIPPVSGGSPAPEPTAIASTPPRSAAATAAANSGRSPAGPANSGPANTAADSSLAMAAGNHTVGTDGWYSRLRHQALAAGTATQSTTATLGQSSQNPPRQGGAKPSPRSTASSASGQRGPANRPRHSAAQPQPEQGMRSGGVVPAAAASPLAPPARQPRGGQDAAGGYRPGSVSNSGSYWR